MQRTPTTSKSIWNIFEINLTLFRIAKIQNDIAERVEKISEIQALRATSIDALKQKLFELDVFPNISTEVGDIESLTSRFDELVFANNSSFKDFIRQSVGEKAVLSENTRRDLTERKTQFDEAESEMKQAFQSIQPLRKELKAAEEQLKNFNKSLETERNMLSQRIQRMQNTSQRLREIDDKLEVHNKEIGSENADECQTKLDEIAKNMEEMREECNRLTIVMAECDNRNQVIRTLEDRIRILTTHEVIANLEKEIAKIQESVTRPSKEISVDVSYLYIWHH